MAANTSAPSTTSIAQLITEFHKTTGDVPPLLIGATTTLVDNFIYLFGGRLQSSRQISNRLYVLNLNSKVWESIIPHNQAPPPRYFHSANYDGVHHILFYGGMGLRRDDGMEALSPLNDLIFLNLDTMSWEYPELSKDDQPSHRYAHITTFVKDKLIIMGGQDVDNEYLNDIHLYDFKAKQWCTPPLSTEEYQYGTYRSAAFAVTPVQLTPQFVPTIDLPTNSFDGTTDIVEDNNIVIHAYTNFSTTDVTRQLHSWKINSRNEIVEMQDQSESIVTGTALPPPLRFPTAFMCGQQFILAGPHVSSANQQFQIWALDMTSFVWTKIEAGQVLSEGSWLRGLLNEKSNRFVVFGHPFRSMQDDYKDRVQCFEHLACVNMEIFGIYKPPQPTYNAFGQQLGLSLLKDPALSDLKLVTTDGKCAYVNSAILAQRWPSIRQVLRPITSPQLIKSNASVNEVELLDFEKRELSFPDTNVVLIAFLQFIYTDNLVTAQQHQPHILARLLFIGDLFDIPRLKELSTHSLHQMLNIQTASMIYESAILSNAIALQIRALRVLLNAKRMVQRQKQMETLGERPFSPSHNTFSTLSSRAGQPHQSSLLQKYEQQQPETAGGFPSFSARNASSAPTTPHNLTYGSLNSTAKHVRTPSQRSMSTDSQQLSSGKTIKLPSFRVRQTSSSDTEHSPLSSATSSPKLTPTSSTTHVKPSSISSTGRSHTSFWRSNSSSNTTSTPTHNTKKKAALPSVNETKPSKSESTSVKVSAFSFLNNHN